MGGNGGLPEHAQKSCAHHALHSCACLQELGAGILRDLHGQRETILHSKSTLQGVDDSISKGRKVLTSMGRRMIQNKIITIGVVLFLLLAIILVIYAKLH